MAALKGERDLFIDGAHSDPGCALALFRRGRLARVEFCVYREALTLTRKWPLSSRVFVERPTYQGARSNKSRTSDLINLTWASAMLAGVFAGASGCAVHELPANDWKGSETKPINHRRLWQVLTPVEREILGGDATWAMIEAACRKGALKRWGILGAACYPKSFKLHNILDAVAMGAITYGRLSKI